MSRGSKLLSGYSGDGEASLSAAGIRKGNNGTKSGGALADLHQFVIIVAHYHTLCWMGGPAVWVCVCGKVCACTVCTVQM